MDLLLQIAGGIVLAVIIIRFWPQLLVLSFFLFVMLVLIFGGLVGATYVGQLFDLTAWQVIGGTVALGALIWGAYAAITDKQPSQKPSQKPHDTVDPDESSRL